MSDLISRQAAIDAVGYYSLHSGDKLLFADKPLKELPSVQPRKGKWMSVKNYGGISYSQAYSQCDQCHGVTFFGATMHFCPNCGADMRGDSDEKD